MTYYISGDQITTDISTITHYVDLEAGLHNKILNHQFLTSYIIIHKNNLKNIFK